METLPLDVSRLIIGYLDDSDIISMCLTDKKFNKRVCNDEFLTQTLIKKFPITREDIIRYSSGKPLWAYYLDILNRIKRSGGYTDILIDAAVEDRVDLIKIALSRLGSLPPAPAHGNSLDVALIQASAANSINTVKFLLSIGADVHAFGDAAGYSPVERGHALVLSILLSAGLNVNSNNMLTVASSTGHEEIVKILLAHKADVHIDDDEALRAAVKTRRMNIIKILLAAGADINVLDWQDIKDIPWLVRLIRA